MSHGKGLARVLQAFLGLVAMSLGVACVLVACVVVMACATWSPAYATEGGCVDLGIAVAERVEAPEPGEAGVAELGIAVGLAPVEDGSWSDETGGVAELGVAVGYRTPTAAAEHTVTFDAGKGSFAGGSSVAELIVASGEAAAPPDPVPSRTGWVFAGWHVAGAPDASWDAEGASAVPLGAAWDFADSVADDLALHARWELRLDVTVPVSVAFAVDSATGEVTTPEAGVYAIKSRTVRAVEVESLAVESRQEELDGFFDLAEGGAGVWQDALEETTLSVEAADANAIELTLADDSSTGASGLWAYEHLLTPQEHAVYRLGAFSYDSLVDDGGWQGQDPSERLGLKLGMQLSDLLRIKPDLEGAKPITRLKVTVSATP